MSHTSRCIRSDGDWICTPDCAHDRDEAHAREHRLACAVAHEWSLTSNDPAYHVPTELAEALDALELATRESPLRKTKP